MNGRANPGCGWSRRRWVGFVAVVYVLQLLLMMGLSHPRRVAPPLTLPVSQPVWHLASGSLAEGLIRAPWLADPAQFALISPKGFTGALWTNLDAPPARTAEWTEPVRWLTRAGGGIEAGAGVSHGSLPLDLPRVSDRADPAIPLHSRPADRLMTNSALRLLDGLAGRQWLAPPGLGQWEHNDVLGPSAVQVVVNEHGAVVSATLVSGSGLAAADQKALALARSARFNPVAGAPLVWGRIEFVWETRLPPDPPRSSPPAP